MTKNSFYSLDPMMLMRALESHGFNPTGVFTQLNSYENRVFNVQLEQNSREANNQVIVKFYRPGRWSQKTILEEHEFITDLQKEGIPAIAPITQENGKTLSEFEGLFVAYFPKKMGRIPQEFLDTDLKQIGRRLAQLHNIGAKRKFSYRPQLGTNYYGSWEILEFLADWVSPEVLDRYIEASTHLLSSLEDSLEQIDFLRVHGDCHRGNLVHNGDEFFFVDFDDCCTGPAIQDFWMLFSGENKSSELDMMLNGYEELRHFDDHELQLIELLRAYRIIGYAGWIAKRWSDPSFPKLFPHFNSYSYWAEETEALEKIAWSV